MRNFGFYIQKRDDYKIMQQIYYTKLSLKENKQKSYLLSTSKPLPESIFEPIILIGKSHGTRMGKYFCLLPTIAVKILVLAAITAGELRFVSVQMQKMLMYCG